MYRRIETIKTNTRRECFVLAVLTDRFVTFIVSVDLFITWHHWKVICIKRFWRFVVKIKQWLYSFPKVQITAIKMLGISIANIINARNDVGKIAYNKIYNTKVNNIVRYILLYFIRMKVINYLLFVHRYVII